MNNYGGSLSFLHLPLNVVYYIANSEDQEWWHRGARGVVSPQLFGRGPCLTKIYHSAKLVHVYAKTTGMYRKVVLTSLALGAM